MKSSTLKKEFSQSTVQRMRNIITGNSGDRTQIQSGFEKKSIDHSEGDIWEENGKKWTIKNGIKQSISKLQDIKSIIALPLSCPSCSQPMKASVANKKMYSIHGKCVNCVAEMETKIKLDGNWQEYKSNMMNLNKNSSLEDFEMALESWVKQNDTFVTENGEVEDWGQTDKSKIYKEIKSNIEKLKNTKI